MQSSPSSSRTSASEWAQVGLIIANATWTTLCLGGFLPGTKVVTSSLTALLLAVHFASQGTSGRARRSSRLVPAATAKGRIAASGRESSGHRCFHPAGWWVLPFLGYASVNVQWHSPVRWLGWFDWLLWVQGAVTFWVGLNAVRSVRGQSWLLAAFFYLGTVGALLAIYQRVIDPEWLMLGRQQALQFIGRSSGPFGNPNNLAALFLLLLPAAGAAAWRQGQGLARTVMLTSLTALMAVGLALTISRGAWLALALALTAWPLLSSGQHWARRVIVALAVLGIFAVGVGGLYHVSTEVKSRLDRMVADSGEKSRPIMWRVAWELFQESPVLGTGGGSYGTLFERKRPDYFTAVPHWTHNEYLNTLSDYGAVGAVLSLGAAGVVAWRSRKIRPELAARAGPGHGRVRQGLGIGLLAFALHCFVDFHLKIPALMLVAAGCAGLWVRSGWPDAGHRREATSTRRLIFAVLATAVLVVTAVVVAPRYQSESTRATARREIDRLALDSAAADGRHQAVLLATSSFARAVELDASNAQAWADRAWAVELTVDDDPGHSTERGREAEAYARKALAGSVVVPEFWSRLGVALDMQGRWAEAGEAFSETLKLAPASASSWFYHAYHLSLKTQIHEVREMALSEVAISLRLDPRNRAAEALEQRLRAQR